VDSRISLAIQPLLTNYLTEVDAALPGFVQGLYLHGSIALGAFNEQRSDIDFIAVISRMCTAADVECLAEVHQKLARTEKRWELEGSYLQPDDLGKFEDAIQPCPAYHDGVLNPEGHHDINSITWWTLKNRGIAVRGPQPADLPFTVDFERLLANMKQNLNTYWASFTRQPAHIAWLFADYGVQWAVLGVLRQWYTFQTQTITSKTGAGEYALTHLPARWHRIIQEAIAIREQGTSNRYKTRIGRALDAYSFLRYIIRVCNI